MKLVNTWEKIYFGIVDVLNRINALVDFFKQWRIVLKVEHNWRWSEVERDSQRVWWTRQKWFQI